MTTCVRCVRRCAKARGPISAIQPTNRLQTRASIEFSILAVFRFAWVQTCEPGTHEGSHLPRCRHPAQARADRAFGPLAHTARCEPQTLQTLFPGQTVARCCACALRIGISPVRTPFTWGICACADHNNGGDHHYRHNHHGRWPAVTVVMVVMVVAYCLHRRKRRYLPAVRPSHCVGLLHPRRDVALAV